MDISVLDLHEDIVPIDDFWAEYYQLDANTPLRTKGVCVIIDIADFHIKFMKYLTPHNIRTVLKRIQAMPIKEYKFHVVNYSFLVNAAYKIIWPFLPDSIRKCVSNVSQIVYLIILHRIKLHSQFRIRLVMKVEAKIT